MADDDEIKDRKRARNKAVDRVVRGVRRVAAATGLGGLFDDPAKAADELAAALADLISPE